MSDPAAEVAARVPTRRRRLAATITVAAALLIASAWLYFQLPGEPPTATPQASGDMTMRWQPSQADDAWLAESLKPRADPLRFNPQHEPLDREPADLVPPPGARHLSRYALRAGGMIDEVSFWSLDPDMSLDAADSYYRRAALDAGFEPLDHASTTADEARTLVFLPSDGDARTLTIRLTPRAGSLHVTVWLRYAMGDL